MQPEPPDPTLPDYGYPPAGPMPSAPVYPPGPAAPGYSPPGQQAGYAYAPPAYANPGAGSYQAAGPYQAAESYQVGGPPPGYPIAPPPPKKRGRKVLLIVAGVVGLLCIGGIAVAAAGGSSTNSKIDSAIHGRATTASTTAKTGANATTPASATTLAPAATKPAAPAAPAIDKAQTFTGSSDKLIKLKGLSSDRLHVAVMTYRGHSNFIVDTISSDGAEINNLSNAIGHYSGHVSIELGGLGDDAPVAIKVQAQGSWTISVVDLATMPKLKTGTTSGKGAAVLIIPDGSLSGLSTFSFTHSGKENFIVDVYGADSGGTNLVNEIGHFSGQEVVPNDAKVITIQADGAWTVKIDS